jgi:hypothetical protein
MDKGIAKNSRFYHKKEEAMTNSNSSNASCGSPKPKIKGKIDPRHVKIAVLKCQGYSVKDISKEVGMSEDRIYHLLGDENSDVNTEIRRISNEAAEASNRHLSHLFRKALNKLDCMLESGDDETKFRAIDRIIKIFSTMVGKNGPSIQQNFGFQVEKKSPIEIIDDLIIKKRRERGLEPPLPESETEDSPDDEPETTEPPGEGPETPEPPNQEPETPDPSS